MLKIISALIDSYIVARDSMTDWTKIIKNYQIRYFKIYYPKYEKLEELFNRIKIKLKVL